MRCRVPRDVTSRKAYRGFHRSSNCGCGRDGAQPFCSGLRIETDRDRRGRAIANSHKANVGALVRKCQAAATVDDEAEFRRQRPERLLGCEHSREVTGDAADIEHLGRIDPGERADLEIAHRLRFRCRVEKPELSDRVLQPRQILFADAADLQIGAPCRSRYDRCRNSARHQRERSIGPG